MKALVLYYTRSGVTKTAAETVARILECDIAEIIDKKDRMGAINYVLAGRDALRGTPTEIKEPDVDLSKYDLVIFGTPVWAGTFAPAIRTYISAHKYEIKKYAFFATQGANRIQIEDEKYEKLIETKDFISAWITTKEVKKEQFGKLNNFCSELKSSKEKE